MKNLHDTKHVNEVMRDLFRKWPTAEEKRQRRRQLADRHIPQILKMLKNGK